MRNRRGLNRIGMLAIALIIALGAVGVAYGAWVDEIYIEGTIYTSAINASMTCGDCTIDPPDLTGTTSVSCNPGTGTTRTRTISITNALPNTDYYCYFTVSNIDTGDPFESLPIKIESATITPTSLDSWATASVESLPTPTVLDPGDVATGGTVKISTASTVPTPPESPAFTLIVTIVRWNE